VTHSLWRVDQVERDALERQGLDWKLERVHERPLDLDLLVWREYTGGLSATVRIAGIGVTTAILRAGRTRSTCGTGCVSASSAANENLIVTTWSCVVSLPDGDEPFYAAFELLTDETTGAFARFN